ncbi:MAG: acyl dehydratase [Gammaproteobacteria bacterium]|nr:acyl dehydratase [Gammaproteobacteria bacterium]
MSTDSLITPETRAWIGRSETLAPIEVSRRDIMKYAVATEQRIEKYLRGDEAPPMFLYGLLFPIVPLDKLGPDGLARRSLQPELPLKRVMAGGTKTVYHRPIKPGDVLMTTLRLSDIYTKAGATGPLIFVVYALHVETSRGEPVMDEIQTRIVR